MLAHCGPRNVPNTHTRGRGVGAFDINSGIYFLSRIALAFRKSCDRSLTHVVHQQHNLKQKVNPPQQPQIRQCSYPNLKLHWQSRAVFLFRNIEKVSSPSDSLFGFARGKETTLEELSYDTQRRMPVTSAILRPSQYSRATMKNICSMTAAIESLVVQAELKHKPIEWSALVWRAEAPYSERRNYESKSTCTSAIESTE